MMTSSQAQLEIKVPFIETDWRMRLRRSWLLGGLLLVCSTVVVVYFLAAPSTMLQEVGQFQLNKRQRISPYSEWRTKANRERTGYVITMRYTGQQIAGIRALVSQQCWIASFGLPMQIVEPFSNESCLVHSREQWEAVDQGQSTLRFNDYFSKYHFNVHSNRSRNPQLVSWEEFLHSAPRNIIVVTINDIHHKGCLAYTENMCSPMVKYNKTLVETFTSGCGQVSIVMSALEFLKKRNFKVLRNVCLNCHDGMASDRYLYPKHITDHIFGEFKPSEVTVLFNQWRFSMHITPNCQEPSVCMGKGTTLLQNRLCPSPKLFRDAKNYKISTLKSDRIVIAVMVRIEWYLIMHSKSTALEETISNCLNSIVTFFNNLRQRNSDTQPFLTLDIGKYGSSTLQSTLSRFTNSTQMSILSMVKSFVAQVYDNHMTFDEWQNTFTEVSQDRGYVASLQRTIAGRASCLILMGGGHFQELAFQDYLENHPLPSEQCIQHVCMPDNFERLSQKHHKIFNSQLQDKSK